MASNRRGARFASIWAASATRNSTAILSGSTIQFAGARQAGEVCGRLANISSSCGWNQWLSAISPMRWPKASRSSSWGNRFSVFPAPSLQRAKGRLRAWRGCRARRVSNRTAWKSVVPSVSFSESIPRCAAESFHSVVCRNSTMPPGNAARQWAASCSRKAPPRTKASAGFRG